MILYRSAMKPTKPLPPPSSSSRPGWYEVPSMNSTQGFWDGDAWTDQFAPLQPAATGSGGGGFPTTGLAIRIIALGTALGTFLVAALAWLVLTVFDNGVSTNDCVNGLTGQLEEC